MELLDIEKELSGEHAEEALARYDATLVALDERVQAALRDGVSPDEYARVCDLGEATVIARKLLRLQVRQAHG